MIDQDPHMPGDSSPDPGMFMSSHLPHMKHSIPLIGAFTIAALFGTGGYFLGKNHSTTAVHSEQARQISNPPASVSSEPRKSALPPIDSAKLRATLDAEKDPLARFKLALQNIEAWVAKNPKDALDWLATQQPTTRRDEVMRIALNQYSEIDPKGAASWATSNLMGIDLNNTLITIAENWARQNGSEAAAWFFARPPAPERDAAMEGILFSWASNEPAAALEFLKANPNQGELSPTLRRAAMAGWAKTDPEGAVRASLLLSRENQDPGQFANTLANWATMDLQASSQWLLVNLPTGPERTTAAQELATIFASQSPDTGIKWLGKLTQGTERDTAASALAAAWSRSGAADAAKWAASQTIGNLSPEAIATISRNFMMKNTAAFETWRNSLPPGMMKEQAAKVLAISVEE